MRAAILCYECGCSHEVLKGEVLRSEMAAKAKADPAEGTKAPTGGEQKDTRNIEDFHGFTEVGLVWLSIR